MNKSKILVLVEGARVDARLMEHLFQIYEIDAKYKIVSYDTNIYTLYNEMFYEEKPEDMDILQILKEREKNTEKKKIFDQDFTDILLIFDLDPQDPQFSEEKIVAMMDYFTESTDMGKLYLNYPMVEAFYHMRNIPDNEYNDRVVATDELRNHTYKKRVNEENRNHDYSKFAVNRDECNVVIRQNIEKGRHIQHVAPKGLLLPDGMKVLNSQLAVLSEQGILHVLCTCTFFIAEYNPKLLTTTI